MASLDIKLKRTLKVYHEGDTVSGLIVINTKNELQHQGVSLVMEGNVNLQLSAKSVGMFEAFYNTLKPIQILNYSLEVSKAGKFPAGKTEIPFEFPLRPKPNRTLYETYHGVFVNIQYMLKSEMKRSFLNKDLLTECEFLVEYKSQESYSLNPIKFNMSPETISVPDKQKGEIPKFSVTGKLDSTACCLVKPFTGELIVESSQLPIKSIELQLVRVETCGCAEGYAKDTTEIQNIQIADGNVCHNVPIPIYMIFPRLFTCPTLETNNFKVEFEVNIVVVFNNDYLVTENVPIVLRRN